MNHPLSTRHVYAVIFLMGGAIFALDLMTPLGIANGILYTSIVMLAMSFPGKRCILCAAAASVGLVILCHLISPTGGNVARSLANRGLAIVAILFVAAMCLYRQRLYSLLSQKQYQLTTAYELLETALAEQKRTSERLDQVIEAAPSGNLMVDATGTIVLVNSQTEQLFGYSREELLGQPVEMLLPERFQAGHEMDHSNFFQDPKPRSIGEQHEMVGRRRDGTELPLAIGMNPIDTDQGPCVLAALVDLTERTQFLQELEGQRRRLAEFNVQLLRSNHDLDEFAYIASHDLKEPLRGIHNYSTFLLEDYADKLDDEGKAKLGTLLRLTQRLETLIDTLLHFSRVGRQDMAVMEVDLNEVVADVIQSIDISLKREGVAIRIPRPLPVVECDSARIGEVFHNLIANALKYTDKPEPWIEIGYDEFLSDPANLSESSQPPNSDQVAIYVRDNGIGIEEKHLGSIFRIFKRLHGRNKYGGGVGAGLTIAKKIVERSGGTLWVHSTVGEGTTFFFTLTKQGSPHADGAANDSDCRGQSGRLRNDYACV